MGQKIPQSAQMTWHVARGWEIALKPTTRAILSRRHICTSRYLLDSFHAGRSKNSRMGHRRSEEFQCRFLQSVLSRGFPHIPYFRLARWESRMRSPSLA